MTIMFRVRVALQQRFFSPVLVLTWKCASMFNKGFRVSELTCFSWAICTTQQSGHPASCCWCVYFVPILHTLLKPSIDLWFLWWSKETVNADLVLPIFCIVAVHC